MSTHEVVYDTTDYLFLFCFITLGCREGFVYMVGFSCILFGSSTCTKMDCQAVCDEHNSHLVIIDNAVKRDAIFAHAPADGEYIFSPPLYAIESINIPPST